MTDAGTITRVAHSPEERWLEAGTHAALVARGYHAVAILGESGGTAATVARGVASAIAPARRVILADLVGDVPVLRDLSTEPDPEGIEDSFAFGTSLARIARHTPVENFMLLPSASDSVEREEIFRSGRWTRLARHCRASGWLLVVAARSSAPGVGALVEQLDGAILVGSAQPPDEMRVLHRVEPPAGASPRSIRGAPLAIGLAIAALVVTTAVLLWRAYVATPGADDSAALPAVVVRGPDAARVAPSLVPFNPGDSAAAAGYAVEIMSANTRAGANLELQRNRTSYPAATLTAVAIGEARATWYRIIAGAYGDPRQADSLLRQARDAGAIRETGGAVVHAPFALLVDSAASRAASATVLARYHDEGVPAYALLQPDGRVLIYVGAFMRPEESLTFVEELGESSKPLFAYRTGSPF